VIAVIVAIAVMVVALLAGAAAAIKIIREYQRVVLFRLVDPLGLGVQG
jgi:hypothetical protein